MLPVLHEEIREPMRVLEIKILHGPNIWSTEHQRLIAVKIDIGDFEELPTNKIHGFADRLEKLLPTLIEHHCSEGHEGGFFERVRCGTWIGHVIEHLALELQWLAGMHVGYGRTRSAEEYGTYHVVFAYLIEQAGLSAFNAAQKIVEDLRYNRPHDVNEDVRALREINDRYSLGPSTQAIVDEALKRDIPVRHVRECDIIVLGQGRYQKKVHGTIIDSTSFIGIELTDNKTFTKQMLEEQMIPVPKGALVKEEGELFNLIREIGFPLVVKPVNGNHGRNVTTNIRSYHELVDSFKLARKVSEQVVVEKFIAGEDHRMLVVNYKFVAAAKRTPPSIIGDGVSTIEQLIARLNEDPKRGLDHEKVLTRVNIDEGTISYLNEQEFCLADVPRKAQRVFLKRTANISTGGTAKNETETVHPFNIEMAERIARILNMDVCGIDLIAKDLKSPITEGNGAVIEVNASPGLRMHLAPSEGEAMNVGAPIVEALFPANVKSRVPTVAITGTNGKTTTTRLVAHLARQVGYKVGFTVTDGIYINDYKIFEGDCSGPRSAQVVLNDPTVDFAVLECARGGILRSGLGFARCDTSIITNVSDDHLGMDGIDSLEAMTRVKSVVAKSTKPEGCAILNADDKNLVTLVDDLKCKIAFFSLDPLNIHVRKNCATGGMGCVVQDGWVVLIIGDVDIKIQKITDIPLTFGGKAECMIENVLAATLGAFAQGISVVSIANGLSTFVPSHEATPGRMNIFSFAHCDVMVDYGHNPGGFKAIKKFLERSEFTHTVGIITGVGDRRDEDIITMGALAAEMFNEVVIRVDKDLRGRSSQSLIMLLKKGLALSKRTLKALVIPDEIEAIAYCLNTTVPGSLITVFSEHVNETCQYVLEQQRLRKSQTIVGDHSVAQHA
jgi:cyanophycin synthetase